MQDQHERWYVKVNIEQGLSGAELYALGPLRSWSRARDIAVKWEQVHGQNTAHVTRSPDRTSHGADPVSVAS